MIYGSFRTEDPEFNYEAWKNAVKELHGDVQIVYTDQPAELGGFQAWAGNGDTAVQLYGTKPSTFEQDFPRAIKSFTTSVGA